METANELLTLLTEHWQMLGLLVGLVVSGGYLMARHRSSGLRKLLADHDLILTDLAERVNSLRRELDQVRDELSAARVRAANAEARAQINEAEVARLRDEVRRLEDRERELLNRIETTNI